MNFAVGILRTDSGRTITGQVPSTSARHAVTKLAQFAGLAPSIAADVLRAGDDWAVILANAGFAFAVCPLAN